MNQTDEQQAIGKEILDILNNHRGEVQRILRPELLRELNLRLEEPTHDRFMRATLEHLRGYTVEGAWICSTLKGGYYMASSKEELQAYLKNELSRAKHLLKKIGRQRKVAGLPLAGQLYLTGK